MLCAATSSLRFTPTSCAATFDHGWCRHTHPPALRPVPPPPCPAASGHASGGSANRLAGLCRQRGSQRPAEKAAFYRTQVRVFSGTLLRPWAQQPRPSPPACRPGHFLWLGRTLGGRALCEGPLLRAPGWLQHQGPLLTQPCFTCSW